MTIPPTPRPSSEITKKAEINHILFFNAIQVATVKKDPSAIFMISDNIDEYCKELQMILDL
jgi:hypothetical protein